MCCSFWHYCEQTFLGNFVVQFCLFCNSLRYDVQIYMVTLNTLDSTFQIESPIWLSKLCKIYCLVVAILLIALISTMIWLNPKFFNCEKNKSFTIQGLKNNLCRTVAKVYLPRSKTSICNWMKYIFMFITVIGFFSKVRITSKVEPNYQIT